MSLYKYQGIHRHSGSKAKGKIQAGTKIDAARTLAARGIIVTSVEDDHRLLDSLLDRLLDFPSLDRDVSTRWMIDFFRRLATYVGARLSVPDALALMAGEGKDGRNRAGQQEILSRLATASAGGSTLTAALRETGIFPPAAVALVEAGETAGNLDRLLPGVADMLENKYRSRQRRITMLIYPMLMLAALLLVMLLLVLFVLPAFNSLFSQLGVQLPPLTRLVLATGNILIDYGWLIFAGITLAIISFLAALKRPGFRYQADRIILRLPLVGEILVLSDTVNTAAALSALTGGGLPLADSLGIAAGVPANTYLAWQLQRAAGAVRAGRKLVTALGSDSSFAQVFLNLAAAGEETGSLPDSMERAAEICRFEGRSLTKKLETVMEPALLLMVGGLVALLVFALALPLLDTVTIL